MLFVFLLAGSWSGVHRCHTRTGGTQCMKEPLYMYCHPPACEQRRAPNTRQMRRSAGVTMALVIETSFWPSVSKRTTSVHQDYVRYFKARGKNYSGICFDLGSLKKEKGRKREGGRKENEEEEKISIFLFYKILFYTHLYINAKNVLLIKMHGPMQSELWIERYIDRGTSTHLEWDEVRGSIF